MTNNKVGGGDEEIKKKSEVIYNTDGDGFEILKKGISGYSKSGLIMDEINILGNNEGFPYGDEEVAKSRVKEARNQMTIDKIGEKVKGGLRSTIGLNEIPLDGLKKMFDSCENGSPIELSIIKSIINNPKTTPEDLDDYFYGAQEGSEIELLLAVALISHPDLTQVLFDKAYGRAIQAGGPIFDLFDTADKERTNRKILNGILIPQDTNTRNIEITLEENTKAVELYVSENHVPTTDDKCWVSGKSFPLTLSEGDGRKGVVVYIKDKAGNITKRDYIVILKTDKAKEEKEKMENTMQGTVVKIDYEKGMGVIQGSNGKNYFLHFSGMEGKAEAFSELLVDYKVEFILTPTRGKATDSDKIRHWSDLNKAFGMNLESDLMANNIKVKD